MIYDQVLPNFQACQRLIENEFGIELKDNRPDDPYVLLRGESCLYEKTESSMKRFLTEDDGMTMKPLDYVSPFIDFEDIYPEYHRRLCDEGCKYICVLGDMNDTPDSEPLSPLLSTDLKDASDHPKFCEVEFRANNGNRGIGTYELGNDSDKVDYLLLSPALYDRMQNGGIFRKGAWPGIRPPRWEVYPELVNKQDAASDHHAIYADIDV